MRLMLSRNEYNSKLIQRLVRSLDLFISFQTNKSLFSNYRGEVSSSNNS